MKPPIIILGAGRSGTNILRDTLTSGPGLVTWNCDELPLLWRTGNRHVPHDELSDADARPEVTRRIRRAFERLGREREIVVEKTCANSLRPDFVKAAIPDAKFVVILRDGRDVVASAMRRWTGSTKLGYRLRKLRYSPPRELPYYALRQMQWLIQQRGDNTKTSWGPRFVGIDEYRDDHSLAEVCTMQWRRCVERSIDFALRYPRQVSVIHYEDFTRQPHELLEQVLDKLELRELSPTDFDITRIEMHRIEGWRSRVSRAELLDIESVGGELLHKLGYGS